MSDQRTPSAPPKRRFSVEIHIGGDTWNDVESALHEIKRAGIRTSVLGGSSMGYSVKVAEDPEMTHEKYHAAVEAYLQAAKNETPKEDRDHECG